MATDTAVAETVGDFDLDVELLEIGDAASQVYSTDNGCGSTCGACTTGAS